MNRVVYKLANTVMLRAMDIKWSFWKELRVNISTFEFWSSVILFAKGIIARDLEHVKIDNAKAINAENLAKAHWKKLLLERHRRYFKTDVSETYHVVVIDEIESLLSKPAHPLDADTIAAHRLNSLSVRIHGLSANDASCVPINQRQHNLSRFLVESTFFADIIERFDAPAVEALMDLVGLFCQPIQGSALRFRSSRLRAFFELYDDFARVTTATVQIGFVSSVQDVPKEFARLKADTFLRYLDTTEVWPKTRKWAATRRSSSIWALTVATSTRSWLHASSRTG